MEAPAELIWNGYSLAERDRRWNAVREGGAIAGLDAVFVPLGNGPDARYLTQMETAAIVLPTDGRPPVIVTERGRGNAWFTESVAANRAWVAPMTEALREAALDRARIGVSGLKGGRLTHVRAPDGAVIHGAYAEVVRALPHATFEDATDVVGFARSVKSEEESTCLRRAAAIAESGVEELIELAQPGLDEAALYAGVMRRMLKQGSEYYPLALYSGRYGGPPPSRQTTPPIGRRLDRDWLLTSEVSATWGGMIAQEDQPILLGRVPDELNTLVDLQRQVFEAGLEYMKPGLTYLDLLKYIDGYLGRSDVQTVVTLHGRGLGDDGPLITSRSGTERLGDLAMLPGNAWVWKPTVRMANGRTEFQFGGTVLLTDRGAERLSQRAPGLISIA
jgi:Xaa-Pro dipeptidase